MNKIHPFDNKFKKHDYQIPLFIRKIVIYILKRGDDNSFDAR